MASFLSIFQTILHATETAATLAAPFVKAVDPEIGGLMLQATNAAVGVEAAITTPGTGAQKAAAVAAGTSATITAVNGILQSQGKAPLPANTGAIVASTVSSVVDALNAKALAWAAYPQTYGKAGVRVTVIDDSTKAAAIAAGYKRVSPDPLKA